MFSVCVEDKVCLWAPFNSSTIYTTTKEVWLKCIDHSIGSGIIFSTKQLVLSSNMITCGNDVKYENKKKIVVVNRDILVS